MKLDELFRNHYDWKWFTTSAREHEAEFQTAGGETIYVHIHLTGRGDSNGPWQIDFDRQHGDDTSTKLTGQGDAFKILATVNDIIVDFNANEQPYSMVFHADESSRQSLYKRVLPKMAAQMSMHFKVRGDDEFWLFKEPPQSWYDE